MKLWMLAAAVVLAAACGHRPKKADETPTRGQATILVDQGLLPLVEGQAAVFESQYKYATLHVEAYPEGQIPVLLQGDTVRMAVLTRDLTDSERAWFAARQIVPRVTEVAYDAVALVVNRADRDSLITTSRLAALLKGDGGPGAPTLVFDHPASGTVRAMREFAGVDSLPAAYSLRSPREVLEYVAAHPGTIGFTGIDWLYEADSALRSSVDALRVLAVGSPGAGYFKPTQEDIAEGRYAFVRKVYFINCQGTAGLGMGFASFLAGDVGQRIVLKAGLLPVTYPKREIVIRNQLPNR